MNLIGATIENSSIAAVYMDAFGVVQHASTGWTGAAVDAADALRSAVEDELGATVSFVQVYTTTTDPAGTEFAAPGDRVDARADEVFHRLGETSEVPAGVAAARDAFKAAIAEIPEVAE